MESAEVIDVDAVLMRKVAQGDQGAFRQLFERHRSSVATFAFRFVGERARSEELTQEIFFKLYRHAPTYRPSAKFKTFLFRVATNHCLNERRRWEYRVEKVEVEDEAAGPMGTSVESAEEMIEARELEQVVREALAELNERERAAFNLCRWEGLSYREIAEALECSESAVKSLIHRATLSVARRVEALQRRRQT